MQKIVCLEDGIKELSTAHPLICGLTLLHTITGEKEREREGGIEGGKEGERCIEVDGYCNNVSEQTFPLLALIQV